jgi:hypothetical protein
MFACYHITGIAGLGNIQPETWFIYVAAAARTRESMTLLELVSSTFPANTTLAFLQQPQAQVLSG